MPFQESQEGGAPFLSVIIPTCNRNEQLGKCMEAFAPGSQRFAAENYEVIVSDDGRADEARGILAKRFPWAKWVRGPGRGPASNRNNGAKLARGKWLVFVDDDCIPDSRLLAVYAENAGGESLALEGAIHPAEDPDRDMAECPVNTTGGHFWSANIAVERALFESLGGFDPAYPIAAHEDQDLFLRLSARTSIKFLPEARVTHPVRIVSLRASIAKMPAMARAWAIHVAKHRELPGSATNGSIFFDGMVIHFRAAARSILSEHWKRSAYHLLWATAGAWLTLRFLRELPPKTPLE